MLLMAAALARGAVDASDPVALANRLSASLRAQERTATSTPFQQLAAAVSNETYTLDLARYELLRLCGPSNLVEITTQEGGVGLIEALCDDRAWLEEFLCSGPAGERPVVALQALRAIWMIDPQVASNRATRTLAVACALNAGKWKLDPAKAIEWYRFYRDGQRAGKLNPVYDTLSAWDKRFVAANGWDLDSLQWLQDNVKLRVQDYPHACWQAAYRGFSLFGDTVQGPLYYMPWDDLMSRAENARRHGGVCGSLSTYGATAARANGIPASTMGEPGHCAYTVRVAPGKWQPAYSLSWRRGLHNNFYDNSWTYHILTDAIFTNAPAVLASSRFAWQARLHAANDPARSLDAWRLSLRTQPIHFEHWRDMIASEAGAKRLATDEWLSLTRALLAAMKAYPEAAWDLIASYAPKVLYPSMNAEQRAAFFRQYHETIKQEKGPDRWDFESVVSAQFKAFGDKNAEQKLFASMLQWQSGSPHYFAPLVAWGQEYFGKNPKDARGFAAAVAAYARSAAAGSGGDALTDALGSAMLAAAGVEDVEAFQALAKLAAGREKGPTKQPQFVPFAGELLSEGGVCKVSSSDERYDKPTLHAAVLGPGPGAFHTTNEEKPWCVVRMARVGRLSGIVVINQPGQNRVRQVPLRVSVSDDGRDWDEVFATDKAEDVWRIDLAAKNIKARYVKVERSDTRKEFFHLVNVLVYGQRLQ